MRRLQLYWLNTNKNRFYRAVFERDILTLRLIYGSTVSARGGTRVKTFNTVREGINALRELKKRRKCRGYEPVNYANNAAISASISSTRL